MSKYFSHEYALLSMPIWFSGKSKIILNRIILKSIRSLCVVFSFIRDIWNVCNHCAGYICKSKRVTYILWAYLRNLRYNVFYICVLKAIFKSNLINMGSILFVNREARLFPLHKTNTSLIHLRVTLIYTTSFVAQQKTYIPRKI